MPVWLRGGQCHANPPSGCLQRQLPIIRRLLRGNGAERGAIIALLSLRTVRHTGCAAANTAGGFSRSTTSSRSCLRRLRRLQLCITDAVFLPFLLCGRQLDYYQAYLSPSATIG